MTRIWRIASNFLASSLFAVGSTVNAAPLELTIETRILPFDPVDGMKSRQTLLIDFDRKHISNRHETGSTYGIPSTRDTFEVKDIRFSGSKAQFTVLGETGSGVQVIPNINYKFKLEVDSNGSAALIGGCHDGYPAYKIEVGRRTLYEFRHKPIRLYRLFGDCDVSPPSRSIGPR